ncbi:transcription-repair coupling factor [Paraferrimonas sp. SM1919]|uniref:transcription-repair coupling factor n=1 Tax=Paraferrimonas sp. SM1919 TaxID=2662263 RepID=UPI0013D7D16A|nr:transcription-repair coupling factor [Paraferrimonas sp. SM1919]
MNLQSPFQPQAVKSNTDKRRWQAKAGVARSITLHQLAANFNGLTLVLTHDAASAVALETELSYLANDIEVSLFPDRETLPYDSFSPHQEIISHRLQTLAKLPNLKKGIVIVPITTAMVRLPPRNFIGSNVINLKVGDTLDFANLRQQLVDSGYRQVEAVYEHGEFAVRGSIIDLYPMGNEMPYRIELFDDEVESIRSFDLDSQRSLEKIAAINMLPANEIATDQAGIDKFRHNYRQHFSHVSNEKGSVYQQVSNHIFPTGIESYLPLFFDETVSIFDYLSQNTQLLTIGDIEYACRHHLEDIQARHQQLAIDPLRPLLPPNQLFLGVEDIFSKLKPFPRTQFDVSAVDCSLNISPLPDLSVNHKLNEPLSALLEFLPKVNRIVFSVESQGRKEALLNLLKKIQLKPKESDHFFDFIKTKVQYAVIISPLSYGCYFPDKDLAIICETELFGLKISQERRRHKQKQLSSETLIRNLAELKVGQAVVHLDHGIGLYQGLETLNMGGNDGEFLKLEYKDGDIIYVPVGSLHLIGRYSGADEDHIQLNKLGSKTWENARKKAAEKVRDVAAELLDIYAQRQSKKGTAIKIDELEYQKFAASFPFEETLDQETAINAVLSDMALARPMDRLVCGDVGFGKTEVAMRATFAAVSAGKQVAILVPTTLLAQQHYDNFVDRFSDWPINIDVMSRFKSVKQQNQAIIELEKGNIDIIVGTHKLIQDGIKFKDLGLLIVDEEHRFGVRQKEQLKKLRANVDILNMTATPIPRTLNMAMSGMRDLSIIATPPAKRLAIKTFVRETGDELKKEAILREILRGGQCYYLHNEVSTIEKCAEDLRALIPEAQITIAHGQMRERELEQVMSNFYHKRFNVLVCSTIIETGIDVPTANTIVIDRADKFGLAQLHQLRGRVGRSHHQAYAYLLTPPVKRLTKDAQKRLEAISELQDLGAGFMLATQDLEIRGAGELLGDEQSGHISKIGFSLYMEMLDDAVKALKKGEPPSLDKLLKQNTEIELRVPALIPDDYIRDVNSRLSLYKRIASCDTPKAIDELQVEMIDRFGLLPASAKNLLTIANAKLRAKALGLNKLEIAHKGGQVEFAKDNKVDPIFLIGLLQSQPNVFKMDGPSKLRFAMPAEEATERLELLENILNQFEANILKEAS